MGPKDAGLHPGHLLSGLTDNVFIKLFCQFGTSGFCKAGTVALAAAGIKGKLGDQQKFSPHIRQGKVGLSVFILKDPQPQKFS